jgi:hypothetical protein
MQAWNLAAAERASLSIEEDEAMDLDLPPDLTANVHSAPDDANTFFARSSRYR